MKVILIGALLVTAYHPGEGGGGGVGALGHEVRPGLTCAVSRDLRHLLGREIHIDGVGWRFAQDLMGPGITRAVDLCVTGEEEAGAWGRRRRDVKAEGVD